jgi:hypothetical protein
MRFDLCLIFLCSWYLLLRTQLAKTKRNLEFLKRTIDFAFAGSSVTHSESLELLTALRAVDAGKQTQEAVADTVFAHDAAMDVASRRVMLLFQRRFLEHMSVDFKVCERHCLLCFSVSSVSMYSHEALLYGADYHHVLP